MSLNNQRRLGLIERLRTKTLPQIGGYNGDYTDEDYVLETFAEAANEIEQLRAESDAWAFDYSKDMERQKQEINRLREALAKIASQSPSTPPNMLIEYARQVFSQSVKGESQ